MAPKRPMSAFLKYSQTRRKLVRKENPHMSNTDISRLLGEMWRNAGEEEKRSYEEQERKERAKYKKLKEIWSKQQARDDAASRTSHQSMQRMASHQAHPQTSHHASSHGQVPASSDSDALLAEYPLPYHPQPYYVHGHGGSGYAAGKKTVSFPPEEHVQPNSPLRFSFLVRFLVGDFPARRGCIS